MAVVAVGGLLAAAAVTPAANAVSLGTPQAAPQGVVTPVAKFGGGRMGGAHMGRMGGARMGGMRGPRMSSRFIGRPGGGASRLYRGPRHAGPGPGLGSGHHHHHHRGHRGLYFGVPFVAYGAYYGGDYGYGSGCGWLRRRAEATGSSYWWARYQDCIQSDY
jgi:hypothetical protein